MIDGNAPAGKNPGDKFGKAVFLGDRQRTAASRQVESLVPAPSRQRALYSEEGPMLAGLANGPTPLRRISRNPDALP